MKKYIIGLVIGLVIAAPATVLATGEWSEWIDTGSWGRGVKKIYDHENKLVCWIYDGARGGGISCQPSIELENPRG